MFPRIYAFFIRLLQNCSNQLVLTMTDCELHLLLLLLFSGVSFWEADFGLSRKGRSAKSLEDAQACFISRSVIVNSEDSFLTLSRLSIEEVRIISEKIYRKMTELYYSCISKSSNFRREKISSFLVTHNIQHNSCHVVNHSIYISLRVKHILES